MTSYVVLFRWVSVIVMILISFVCFAQKSDWQDSISDYKARKKILLAAGASSYGVGSYILYNNWYKDFDRSGFHFFDDGKEWRFMDKSGHFYASYIQGSLLYDTHRWAGYSHDESILRASALSLLYQTTIEIIDGFSTDWGFSAYDMMANIGGVGLFATQQKLWGEQRIKLKMSYYPTQIEEYIIPSTFESSTFTLKNRSDQLFGDRFYEQLIKDYNGQTIWISSNPRSWLECRWWPKVISLAFGYGVENLYGGFENSWVKDFNYYNIDPQRFPRYSQFFFALDYDLSKIKTKNKLINTILRFLDIFKWPAPALELNSKGELSFHLLLTR